MIDSGARRERRAHAVSNLLNYKGYLGEVSFSETDALFFGKVLGIKAYISFEGENVQSLIDDFHASVDEYLEFCQNQGLKPEKPYKGSFNIRIGADLHRKAARLATERGISLNALVENAIRHIVDE